MYILYVYVCVCVCIDVREGRVPAQVPTEAEFFGEHLMFE
jgi:hypothetical protein